MTFSLPANSVAERYLRLCDQYLLLSDRFAELLGSYDSVQERLAQREHQCQVMHQQLASALADQQAAQATIADLHTQIEHLRAALAQAQADNQALLERCRALEILAEFHLLLEPEALARLQEVEQVIALNQEIFTTTLEAA
ncbi:MAG: hypothetical protein Q6J68_06040 [Thermostichales cyanobacterium SZTDM-1c_bins_54]